MPNGLVIRFVIFARVYAALCLGAGTFFQAIWPPTRYPRRSDRRRVGDVSPEERHVTDND